MTRPDFIIIGAMKAGTTTLYDHCAAHPEIGMSRLKETDYFIAEKNWHLGAAWYARQFPKEAQICGEASPNYTKANTFAGVPARIASHAPECRLIFVARDPVARAQSQYRHAVLSGARRRLNGALRHSPLFGHLVEVSSYARQCQLYLEHFSRSQLLILDFDQMITDPASALSKVARFLGVRDAWPPVPRANSSALLAHLPAWTFRYRESGAARTAKTLVPRQLVSKGLGWVSRGAPTPIPELSDRDRADLAAALAADASAFRALSGMAFAHWSV